MDPSNCNRSKENGDGKEIPRLPGLKPIILPAWQFSHGPTPRPSADRRNSHNSRRSELTFDIGIAGVCHGLAGYFECILYPGVELSTNPHTIETKSPDLVSWLTMFFPLKVLSLHRAASIITNDLLFKAPCYVERGLKLRVILARKTNGRQVWYEWELDCMWPMDSDERQHYPKKIGISELQTNQAIAYQCHRGLI